MTSAIFDMQGKVAVVTGPAAGQQHIENSHRPNRRRSRRAYANNLKSVLWLAAMALPGMKSGGSFIVVGSIGGILANTVIGAYGMSKAADHHLVRNLAAEWGPRNVRVNAIAPGLVKTEFARALWEDEKRRTERLEAT